MFKSMTKKHIVIEPYLLWTVGAKLVIAQQSIISGYHATIGIVPQYKTTMIKQQSTAAPSTTL